MRLKAYKTIGDPQPLVRDVSVILIEGDNGQPVVVAADIGGGVIAAEVAKPSTEVEFNRILRSLGFDRVVIVEDLAPLLVPMNKQHQMPDVLSKGPTL